MSNSSDPMHCSLPGSSIHGIFQARVLEWSAIASPIKKSTHNNAGEGVEKTELDSDTREGNGTPLQYSCLENPMDRGAWKAAVHGVTEGWIRLSDFTFMQWRRKWQPNFSVLAWRILGMAEPGGLPSMGSQRVGHD